jgi:hypothetical protein
VACQRASAHTVLRLQNQHVGTGGRRHRAAQRFRYVRRMRPSALHPKARRVLQPSISCVEPAKNAQIPQFLQGSTATACLARSLSPLRSTTQSRENGDFLTRHERPAVGGHCRGACCLY